jgi:hypothetical protein
MVKGRDQRDLLYIDGSYLCFMVMDRLGRSICDEVEQSIESADCDHVIDRLTLHTLFDLPITQSFTLYEYEE